MAGANWFFGFPVAGSFVLDLPPLPTGFRRFHPDDLHLTLAFLGTCGEKAAERALTALDEQLACAPLPSRHVSLGGVAPMGPARHYSALSALLVEGRLEVEASIAALRAPLLASAGLPPDLREAKAHITLARPQRRATQQDRQAGLAWAAGLELSAVRCTLDRVALYTWDRTREERLFRIAAERSLR